MRVPTVRSSEQGQVLVIFVGGLMLLLAVAAVVIDLGFAFMIRRQEQNAVDPGAIAAARYIRSGAGGTAEPTKMREAACFYAHENGFFTLVPSDTSCASTSDPDGAVLTVNYPPSAQAGTFAGSDDHVEVGITRLHQTFFARLFAMLSIPVTSSAIAAFSDGPSNTASLIALDPGNSCQSGKTHGTGDITIHPLIPGTDGGYVHVNSTCSNGPPNSGCDTTGQGGLDIVGTGTLTSPHTYVVGTCKANGGLLGPLTEGAVVIGDPLAELAPPRISDYPDGRCGAGGQVTTPTGPFGCNFPAGSITLDPGVYYGGWLIGNRTDLVLRPGVYIIAGGGIRIQGSGELTSVQGVGLTPAPVLIYNTDGPACATNPAQCQTDLNFSALSTVVLRAVDSGPYKGILLWNDGFGSHPASEMNLLGGTNLDVAGTIYNPKGLVKVDGGASGSSSTAAIQIIAWHFDVGGNADLDMPYDPSQLYQFPQKGLVK